MLKKAKKHFAQYYLVTQERKIFRIFDYIIPFMVATAALSQLFILHLGQDQYFSLVKIIITFTYLLTLMPIAYLLIRRSDLLVIERFALRLFILASGISLVLFSMLMPSLT